MSLSAFVTYGVAIEMLRKPQITSFSTFPLFETDTGEIFEMRFH